MTLSQSSSLRGRRRRHIRAPSTSTQQPASSLISTTFLPWSPTAVVVMHTDWLCTRPRVFLSLDLLSPPMGSSLIARDSGTSSWLSVSLTCLCLATEDDEDGFFPPLPPPPLLSSSSPVINGEKAAYCIPTFLEKRERTLEQLMKATEKRYSSEVCKNYIAVCISSSPFLLLLLLLPL